MPSSSVDPERLLGLGAALEGLRVVAQDAAEEVLGHLPELGDRPTQHALDGLLDQLADTLRALDSQSTELSGRLRVAATSLPGPAPTRPAGTGEIPAPPRKGLFR